MKKAKIKRYIIPTVIILGVIFTFVNTYFKTKKEYGLSYDFVITKLDITPTRRFIFYDGENEIQLCGFIISSNENIKPGDVLYKPACSDKLQIVRKDVTGKNLVISETNYAGMFPSEFFCD